VRNTKEVTLYSRRQNVLNNRFGYIASALEYLPSGTVIDGQVVGLGPNGHADFYLLQKFRSAQSNIVYYVFDILVHEHRDLTRLPLSERRQILSTVIKQNKHVALSVVSNRPATEMLEFAKTHGLEGLVAKRADRVYQSGQRTGLWSKYRINMGRNLSLGDTFPAIWVSIRSLWASIAGKTSSMRLECAPVLFPGLGARSSRRSDT
jgi:ATP-dependent DNA ligase